MENVPVPKLKYVSNLGTNTALMTTTKSLITYLFPEMGVVPTIIMQIFTLSITIAWPK